ncbi:MAG: hypothetical protein JO324_02755 [Candidatus Eremiobacteraeota bacterium]|nr:hypothetical protein [Candidatus Eremiobacteraeota bacterium]
MSFRLARPASLAACAALAACSSSGSNLAPARFNNIQMSVTASGEHVVRIGAREIRFGGAGRRAQSQRGWIAPAGAKDGRALLYGSSYDGGFINIYHEHGTNQSPIGQLTNGLVSPQGIIVDKHHQIWVANTNAFTILGFQRGATTAFTTLNDPGYFPVSIAVDGNGTVYAANAQGQSGQSGNVTYWTKGSTNPSGTLTYSTFQVVLGIGVDASNNVYVSYVPKSGPPAVVEFPAGSQTGQVLPMSDVTISDITFDKQSNLVMEDGSGGLGIWAPPYSGPPSRTLNAFGNEPTLGKHEHKVWIAYANFSNPMIEGYDYITGTQVDVITNGWTQNSAIPYGVAVDPPAKL